MKIDVSAVVLSSKPYGRTLPGVEVIEHVSTIRTPRELQAARFSVLVNIRTEYAFYLDDDDWLTHDYLSVIEECIATRAAVAYTDERIVTPTGERIRHSAPYSQDLHLEVPTLIHHLAVFKVKTALEAIQRLPTGLYCPELPLYFELAKQGAAYVPRIGYVWNKKPEGMHRWPHTTLSWANAQAWCFRNR